MLAYIRTQPVGQVGRTQLQWRSGQKSSGDFGSISAIQSQSNAQEWIQPKITQHLVVSSLKQGLFTNRLSESDKSFPELHKKYIRFTGILFFFLDSLNFKFKVGCKT